MQERSEYELTDKEFLDCMKKNSRVVRSMPDWMKGSPVNRRMQEPAVETEAKSTKTAKAAAHTTR